MTSTFWPLIPVVLAGAAAFFTAVGPTSLGRPLARLLSALLLGFSALIILFRVSLGLDALSGWFLIPVLVVGALGLWGSLSYLEGQPHGPPPDDQDRQPPPTKEASDRRYLALYEAFIATIALVVTAPSLLVMWGAVEATTLASVFLVSHNRSPQAIEAAWKYLAVTAVGGLLALLGTVAVAAGAHVNLSTSVMDLPRVAQAASQPSRLVLMGFVFTAIGFGTKAGLAPLHTWLPDAHSEAPAPVSALLSGVELAVAFYALLRVVGIVDQAVGSVWPHRVLIVFGLLSLGIAAAFASSQTDMKRLFAYSSVEHMGLISLGIGLGGLAAVGALLHVWTHGAGKSLLFLGSGKVKDSLGTTFMPDLNGVTRRLPVTGVLLGIGTWAIVGLPPFGPFFSEWLILTGSLSHGGLLPSLLGAALVVATLVGFGRRLPGSLLGRSGRALEGARVRESLGEIWPLLLLAAVVIAIGVAGPAFFRSWLDQASQIALGRIW